ncbi:hypothetical protein [Streptomyces sp. NPDC001680]
MGIPAQIIVRADSAYFSHKLGWRLARAVVTARKSVWVPAAFDVDMTLAC